MGSVAKHVRTMPQTNLNDLRHSATPDVKLLEHDKYAESPDQASSNGLFVPFLAVALGIFWLVENEAAVAYVLRLLVRYALVGVHSSDVHVVVAVSITANGVVSLRVIQTPTSHTDEDRACPGGRDGPRRCTEHAGLVVVVDNRSAYAVGQMDLGKVLEKALGTFLLYKAAVVGLEAERASIHSNDTVATPTVTTVVCEGGEDGREEEQKEEDESEQHYGRCAGRRLAQ